MSFLKILNAYFYCCVTCVSPSLPTNRFLFFYLWRKMAACSYIKIDYPKQRERKYRAAMHRVDLEIYSDLFEQTSLIPPTDYSTFSSYFPQYPSSDHSNGRSPLFIFIWKSLSAETKENSIKKTKKMERKNTYRSIAFHTWQRLYVDRGFFVQLKSLESYNRYFCFLVNMFWQQIVCLQ